MRAESNSTWFARLAAGTNPARHASYPRTDLVQLRNVIRQERWNESSNPTRNRLGGGHRGGARRDPGGLQADGTGIVDRGGRTGRSTKGLSVRRLKHGLRQAELRGDAGG